MATDLAKVLSENVSRLKARDGGAQADIAQKGGISQRSVSNLLSYGTTHETAPTLRTVEGVARAFKVEPWSLFVPGLPVEVLQASDLRRLIETFVHASPASRDAILRIAEMERRYAAQEAHVRATGT